MLLVPIDVVKGEETVIGESHVFALHGEGSQGPIERSIPRTPNEYELSQYEKERLKKIQRNKEMMIKLGLLGRNHDIIGDDCCLLQKPFLESDCAVRLCSDPPHPHGPPSPAHGSDPGGAGRENDGKANARRLRTPTDAAGDQP